MLEKITFWSGQMVYLEDIFLPIMAGVGIFAPVLLLIFWFGFRRRWRVWKLGQPDDRYGNWWQRLTTTLTVAIANRRIFRTKEAYAGTMHLLIFGGAAIILIGKIIRLFSYVTGISDPPQDIYLGASWASEIGALLLIIGLLMAAIRRYIIRPARLNNKPEDSLIYIWLSLIVLTGFMIKGYRIAASDTPPADWARWSPVGYLVAKLFLTYTDPSRDEILVWHRVIFHTVPAVFLLVYVWLNRSRLQHILLSPLNVFFRSLAPKGALKHLDLESAEHFGADKIEDFTWKQILDLDACTSCGRCQDACPAYFSGKSLNPQKMILDLKEYLYQCHPGPLVAPPSGPRPDMISDIITEQVIWDCTTCRACMESCPVYVEHIDKIIEMRRNLAMERVHLPAAVQNTLKCLSTRGHPFRGTMATRTTWQEGFDIPGLGGPEKPDLLYWVGCTAALEERNMSVARAMVKILRAAGVKFTILGEEERCCGDPARRLGDEYLFQTICQGNIELFKSRGVTRIITSCPHCYNSFKNEYPQYGGNFAVIHHTQLIADLIQEGKIRPGGLQGEKITYHDSCYLGRYNDIYREPRAVLRSLAGHNYLELRRCLKNSFCCGGGGGHMWMEEPPGQRVNVRRIDEILQTGARTVATACPYCLSMFEDGIRSLGAEANLQARDISELVASFL